jgi:DEAD/DEAH box helicase
MDRALSIELLRDALAGRTELPTAAELQRMLADVEVQLFLRRAELPDELLDAAWYLHAVASVDQARERYTVARQRQAFLVSAHIFDLALSQDGWSKADRLSFGFAAAIGYRRGDRDPNATAIVNRLRGDIIVDEPVLDHIDTLALEAGLALLGFETRTLFGWLRTWRRQLAEVARTVELNDLTTTAFGTTQMVVLGADDLLTFLAHGNHERLERAQVRLRAAALGEAGPGELDARWVASHLLGLSGEAEAGSLWSPNVLPPNLPNLVRQAFTVGSPPVLTLWSPQRDLLVRDPSPFDPRVRRMVLSVPTSGGKTLIAQMLAVAHLERSDSSVCYVAPTRSLGREVRKAMASRVRILERETGPDQPDYPSYASEAFGDLTDLFDGLNDESPPDVEVMTPERLAHLLRHDASAVLDRFGLFIFDEAQLIKERGRGFTLESTIALLHYATRDSDHQIVLISAALGNAGAIAQWIGPDDSTLLHQSEWRGPRRLHAAICTQADWSSTRLESISAPKYPFRLVTDLSGLIRLRLSDERTAELETQGSTGWRLVRKAETPVLFQRGLERDGGARRRITELLAR